MRKNVFGRRFKRDKNERTALFKGLISSLVLKERIITTQAKAKAIKADADKIITKAKKNKDLARRSLGAILNKEALEKLINDLTLRFANRKGGYTRIIKIGRRLGDDAMEVIIEWTEGKSSAPSPTPADAAHKSKTKISKSSRSLSEPLQQSSTRKPRNTRRRSVAPRSGKGTSQKNKKEKK